MFKKTIYTSSPSPSPKASGSKSRSPTPKKVRRRVHQDSSSDESTKAPKKRKRIVQDSESDANSSSSSSSSEESSSESIASGGSSDLDNTPGPCCVCATVFQSYEIYSCGYYTCPNNICVACSLNKGLPDPSMLPEDVEAFCDKRCDKKYFQHIERRNKLEMLKRDAEWKKPGAHVTMDSDDLTYGYFKRTHNLASTFVYKDVKYKMPKVFNSEIIDCFFEAAQTELAKPTGSSGIKSYWDHMIKRIEPDFTQWPGVEDYDDVCTTDDNASDNTSDATDKTDSGDDAGDESESESNDAGDESESDGKAAGKRRYIDVDTLLLRQDSDLSEEGLKMEGRKRPNKAPKRQKKDKKAPKRHKK